MTENEKHATDQQEILAVDDNPTSLQYLIHILKNAGYIVRPAPNGAFALRSVEAKKPDLILLDVKMPDMDGYEVCRRLKSDELSRDIPVIFISGLGETTQRVQGFNAGGVDYITKPFEPEEVLARVNTHLRLRELTERLEQKVKERTEELQQEIMERKRTEESLRKSEALLNATQQISLVGGWEFDVASGESFWTDEVYRIHEIPKDARIDPIQVNLNCYNPHDRQVVYEAFENAYKNGISYDFEFPFTTYNKREIWIRTTAEPVYENGTIVRVIGSIMDISKSKEVEQELTKYRLQLEELVEKRTQEVRELSKALTVAEQRERRRMSHLLHDNLLQKLLSTNLCISMLSSDIKDNPGIMQMVSEVKQMNLEAINATKTLAVEFNPPILKHEGLDVALKWLIQHFQSQYRLEVRAVSLEPCREMDPDIRFLLVQFVRELFTNIVKHAKTDKAELTVKCNKKVLSVFVKDRGAGFDVAKAREIAKAREYLGIFSIEDRLALIGGRLKIVSVPGKGTLVRIIVPTGVSFLSRFPS